ncbi:MAG: tyrosine-type recombinase/integrase [Agathobaculum sp.]|uniref:tyrosine-type recombinase/integrase n=1 Tax=Agathobaculum sp. TaxID=2048138 RepID=UPI003D8B54F3
MRQNHFAEAKQDRGLRLTRELEAQFLEALRQYGRAEDTINGYRRNLERLRQSLPEDMLLNHATLSNWQMELLNQGYSSSTVNGCTAAVNSLLEFARRRDLQIDPVPPTQGEAALPELTRSEYMRLLQTAKMLNKRRAYLLVLLFGTVDLPLQSLPCVTVEAVKEGRIGDSQRMRLPPILREELLTYAEEKQIHTGPIFQSRNEKPMTRSNVNSSIQALARNAGVDVEKCNSRCLRKMCLATQHSIRKKLEELAEQTYDRMLETEAMTVGWNDSRN